MDLAETRLKALMLASLDGDAKAYRALLAALAPHLRAYFARRLAQAADAEDLVQETLIAIHSRRASYDATLPFTAWLHAIARYKLIDHFRRGRLRRTLPLEDAGSVMAEESHEASAAAHDVERLLATLPENRRSLIRQVKIEGLSTAEAAARTGQSESAVKVGIHRGLKKLAALIREKP
ncbi:MAG: sigma-70 family RNA polymerase sigma factor [Alphaproteobacteria bacterium]|nr:sigma-70 family RNA polymerase sigma factor [Alphaproteobacteria bacterium]